MKCYRRLLYLLICASIVILDQLTKFWAVKALTDKPYIRLFDGDLFWLVLVYNPGMVFGLRFIPPIILTVISFLAAIGLGIYLMRNIRIPFLSGLPLTMIMGGAIGNLIDRMRIGEVIDFFSVDMPDFIMSRFPVFNIADSAISVGVTLLILMTLFPPASQGQVLDVKESKTDFLDSDNNISVAKIPESIPDDERFIEPNRESN